MTTLDFDALGHHIGSNFENGNIVDATDDFRDTLKATEDWMDAIRLVDAVTVYLDSQDLARLLFRSFSIEHNS